MVAAIVLGLLVGVVSFLPLLLGINLARKASPASNLGHAGALMLGVFISFVILAVAVIVCIVAFRDYTVPFALAEAGALIACAIVFGFTRLVGRK